MSADKNSMSNVLLAARSRLLWTGLYLTDKTLCDKVHWVAQGHGHTLALLPQYIPVICDSANKAVMDLTAATTMVNIMTAGTSSPVPAPSDCATSKSSIVVTDPIDGTHDTPGVVPITSSNGSLGVDLSVDDTTAAPHILACLAAIVRVDSKDFWLSTDGGYQGPNHISKEIIEVKPSCAVCAPCAAGVLNDDFTSVVSNLRLLQDRCVSPGYSPGKSFFSADSFGNPRFKVCHTFLEPLEGMQTMDEHIEGSTGDVDRLFTFENWPLTKEKNRAELLALKTTHRLVPMVAMDVSGHRVSPYAYRRCLQGAIVELHFMFSHWGIARNKQDIYAANIIFMRVLVPPRTFSMPANKWLAPAPVVASESTTKKSRCG
ncbi:hypothetical protein BKA82DRAFT_20240 [Pisolithus tinctorius]|uniref:Uncharacterized protein n=1 Tax=Pisolithus tinctorius Marx 270 TaxID=870435 RepID=A0A0C3PRA5_PISTI|nr:hypothetical protein BKA82DRAFT_20240 [Pisolithus tinctorius]KIO11586.1 hypothetical protein M404DRAFT_20240 [Pisolithus tinctorius Marx 270]